MFLRIYLAVPTYIYLIVSIVVNNSYVRTYDYSECLDAIERAVDVLPDYFEKFCSILNIMSFYNSLIKSLVTCYVVYKSEIQIKRYIDIEKILSHFKASLTGGEILELSQQKADTDKHNSSREENFIKILQRKCPKFIDEFVNYLALEDCPNHSELYHHLQNLKDEVYKSVCISSAISYLPGIKRYQDFLKRFYTDMANVEAQNTLKTNIHQYVNLSLITPQNQDNDHDYFKALKDPFHLLFNHKEYTTTVPLNSLIEIFDTSESNPQIILIQGSPGSGKTTLANKVCIEWAKGNLIQHYMLVILLKLRDPRISDIESIDEMVKCTMGDNFASEVVRDIKCIDGENILLLLEGWDELPEEKQQKSFFTDAISGKALQKCSVLITSRPSSIGSIQKRFITRHIAILGFSEDQIEQYLDRCFADSSNELKDSLKYKFLLQLKSNSALMSLAYVPVNLSILVHVFTQCGTKLPSTFTELYKQYMLLKLSLYNQRISDDTVAFTELDCLPVYISESLNILCELAYSGLKTQKLHFTQNEMQKLYQSVPLDYDGMGLLQVENHMLNRGSYKTYNFIHRTVQEFLAAWHLAKRSEPKNNILESLQTEHFEMVLVFFSGLTGLRLFDFAEFLPFIKDERFDNVAYRLGSHVGNCVAMSFFRALTKTRFWHVLQLACNLKIKTENINRHRFLVLVACCSEAKNPAVCKAISNSSLFHRDGCYVHLPESATTSHLLSSLSYFIAHSGKNWGIEYNKILSEQDIINLQKYLISSNETSGKIYYLQTQTNRNTIYFLATFLQPHFTLCSLDLQHSVNFDDDCVTVLSEELKVNCSLIILDLGDCNISSKGVLTIAEMLQVNNTLQWIGLAGNKFSADDLIQVLMIIKNNTTLVMMAVDNELLLQEQVKKQLIMFNRKRRNPLILNVYQLFRFGGLVAKILE